MCNLFLSTFVHGDGMDSPLYELLNAHQHRSGVQTHLRVGSWIDGWSSLYGYALSRSGPDVSEVGSTWVGDLARMHALSSFSRAEVASIVGDSPFLEKSWVLRQEDGSYYSIPWATDMRMIFYRRDLLERAGIDESTAFADMPHFMRTLAGLRDSLGSGPLAMPTVHSRNALQTLATWVWSAGGDFLSADDRELCFDRPEALAGARAVFELKPYLCPRAFQPGYRADSVFSGGEAAVLVSGSWILQLAVNTPEVRENLGVAALPGQAFVGGSHLVFWEYSRQRDLALGLIHFLHESENIPLIYPWVGLPVRESAWRQAPFSAAPYRALLRSLRAGRSFSSSQRWGLVEKRLIDTITSAWEETLYAGAEPGPAIENALAGLAARLRPALDTQ